MNKKKVIIISVSAAAAVCLIVAGIVIFILTRIGLGVTLNDFKFMGHTITEGDQLNNIMEENDIEYFTGAVCDKDFYAKKNDQGQIYIMCPALHPQDDAEGSTIPEEDRRRTWSSGYVVTDMSVPGNKEAVSITIEATHKKLDEYYEGPIHIGDTMEDVKNIMQIDAIKKYGVYKYATKYETYSFFCTQGNIVFEEKCSGRRDEYDSYSDKLEYLANGHYITYLFRYPKYLMGISFGEDGTVNHIALTYDPEGVLTGIVS